LQSSFYIIIIDNIEVKQNNVDAISRNDFCILLGNVSYDLPIKIIEISKEIKIYLVLYVHIYVSFALYKMKDIK